MLSQRFKNHIEVHLPFLKERKSLIAISGGLDSVVLVYLCYQLKLNISLAHCNFTLRDKESDRDEEFTMQLAERLNLEVFIQKFDTKAYADAHKLSIQIAARELRYEWFKELADQLEFDYILTAHHADDNLETFFINLSRGTGLGGLTGIPEINENIIRPLLPFSRQELQLYAQKNKLKWREDSSNVSTKYLRNKLRHDVIPVLKEINPHWLGSLQNTQRYLKDTSRIVEDRVESISDIVIDKITPQGIYFDIEALKDLNHTKAYLYELIKDYGFTQWDDIYNLLEAQSGKFVTSSTHRLIKDRDALILSEINIENKAKISISKLDEEIQLPIGVLHIDKSSDYEKNENSINTICVDADKTQFPLVVRKWKEGDYFYPFGMKGKKKLSKYFKDEKLSLIDKENTWLLCSDNDIVWIINKRMDDRYKVTDSTKTVLKLKLIP